MSHLSEAFLDEIQAGDGRPLKDLAKLCPSPHGGHVHWSALWRWAMRGIKAPGGRILRLEAARLSGKWISTPQAIRRFIASQTPDVSSPTFEPIGRDAPLRRAEQARRKLSDMGL